MLNDLLENVRGAVEDALSADELREMTAALDALGVSDERCVALLRNVTETPASLAEVRALRDRIHNGTDGGRFERLLLLRSWRRSITRVPALPVDDSVKRLICEEAQLVANPSAATSREFNLEKIPFVALCKMATLRRFPAGQLDWEVSGMPRSWLTRVRPRVLPRVAYWIAVRMRGFAPAFFIHLGAHRKHKFALLEHESNRAYYRMAQAMSRQPEVKGLIASSWLHSPDTMTVSPHLTALNRVFLENHALVTTMGPADPESGVFYRSPERKRLFDEGQFTPTTGLVLWPRTAILAWAAAHPELADTNSITR